MGAEVAKELAKRGAQLILLVKDTSNSWLTEYVNDLREATKNQLIYVEEANLESLYSVRKFATKWLDNSPPRRLDMIICCAGLSLPPFLPRSSTKYDGVETQFEVNYLAHYHLLTLLEPALKVQPADRDVRIVLTTCVSSVMGDLDINDQEFKKRPYPSSKPWRVFGAAKLQLALFGYEFQRKLNSYVRPDNQEAPKVSTIIVDPGLVRTPSFHRFISFGSLFGLFLYLLFWPFWWFILKTPWNGAQTILYAIMSPEFEGLQKVSYSSECRIRKSPPSLKVFKDEGFQRELFDKTAELIQDVEKRGVLERKREEVAKKAAETRANNEKKKKTEGHQNTPASEKANSSNIKEPNGDLNQNESRSSNTGSEKNQTPATVKARRKV